LFAREKVVKSFCPVLYIFIHPFHEVLQALVIYNMLYPCPPASINVPKSSVCVDSLPIILLYKLPYEIVCIEEVLVPAYVKR
ncbi:MAG: hypothetical protein RXR36_02295, partial [Nitrososphaeria archaeon]